MNKQDFLKSQSCVLRVNIHCHGCKSKVKKLLQKIDGVYKTSIDAEQGKVTVTGNVDPAVLVKKLEKNGKHAELWAPSSKDSNQNNHLSNQLKNFHIDGGKIGKDNNKSQKGGKEQQKGGGQQQLIQQIMKGQSKDFKMPTNDQKAAQFNVHEEDEFDDEFDDEFEDESDDDDMHGLYGGGHMHHPSIKSIPIMSNGKEGKGDFGGGGGDKKNKGGEKKGKEDGKGAKKGGGNGGGGMAGLFKGMLGGGNSDNKKGNEVKKDGKNAKKGGDQDQKGGGEEGKKGKKGGGANNNVNGNEGKKGGSGGGGGGGGKKRGGGGFNDMDVINHGKNGGLNIGQMGHHPLGQMGPAAPQMMNAGGGYYQEMGQPGGGPYNPQQQYMAMMMSLQRMNGGDGYGMHQPMMHGRPQMGVGYEPSMVPPPTYRDPFTYYFSDDNTSSCSIM